jgi:large subunit ribosomal protein L10
MSKKVKNLITNELTTKFKPLEGVAVISPRGIDGIKNNLLRRRLREKGLRMTVVKNSLARRAVTGTKLAGFDKLLDGPSAVIHGQVSIANIARLLLEEKKKDDKLEIRGLFFDGELYQGDKGIELASKLPTREEALAGLLGMILGPGRKLAGAIKGPGGKLGAVLKTIEEKAKEKEASAPAPAGAAPAQSA